MSVNDLRARMRDVPGIEGLTMRAEGGKQLFTVNGVSAAVGPFASTEEIEAAIRNATGWPSIEMSATVLAGGGMDAPVTMTASQLPTVNITEPKPMTAPSPTGFQPGEISSLFKSLRARKEAMIADIQANGAEVVAVLEAGEAMSKGLKADADAMKAEFGQLTNFPPAE